MKKILFLALLLFWSCGDDTTTSPKDEENNSKFKIDVEIFTTTNSDLLSLDINDVRLARNNELLVSTNNG